MCSELIWEEHLHIYGNFLLIRTLNKNQHFIVWILLLLIKHHLNTSGMFRSNLNLTQLIQTTLPLPRFLMLSRSELIWNDGSRMFMGIVFIWFMYIQYLECSVCMILPLYNFMGFDSLDLIIYGCFFLLISVHYVV